jgi:hypothetical protein
MQEAITQDEWNAALKDREAVPEPKLEEPKAPEVEPTAVPEPEPVDPYANLHPDVKAKLERFDELSATVPNLVNELKSAKGRISSLQSEWDKSKAVAAAEKPTQVQIAQAAKDPAEWESLKSDFPEWGDAISKFVETRLGSLSNTSGVSPEQIEAIVSQRTQDATAPLVKQLNEVIVSSAHKNWKADINTPAFADWLQVQPADVQQLVHSTDPMDAIQMLDKFAEHKTKPAAAVKSDRQKKLEAAVTTKPGQGNVVTAKSVEDMSPKELWDYEAKKRAAAAA